MLEIIDELDLEAVVFVLLGGLGLIPVAALGVKALLSPRRSVGSRAVASYAQEAELLATEAGQQLLRADEILGMARDELAFAQASFGFAQTQPFADLISAGEKAVTEAFRIQSSMNLLTGAQKSEAARTILSLVSQTIPPIVEAQKGFVSQRDAQATVESRAARAQQLAAELRSQIPLVREKLRALSLEHSPDALHTVLGVPDQVEPLVSSAQEAAQRALGAVSSDRAAAVQAIETAERALRLAQGHIDSVFSFDSSVERSLDALSQGIGSLTADLADVERLGADATAFAPLVSAARQAIEGARLAREGQGSPLEALAALTRAEADIDAALAPLREADEVRARSQASADRYIDAARHAIGQARQLRSRSDDHRAFGSRQSLREAEDLLAQAQRVRVSDPERAIELADRAGSLARQQGVSVNNEGALPGGFAGTFGGTQIDFESLAADFLRGVMRTTRHRRW